MAVAMAMQGALLQAQDYDGFVNAGIREPGRSTVDVWISNVSCPGTHGFRVEVEDTAWLTVTGPNPIRIAQGEDGFTVASLDLTDAEPATYTGTVTSSCTTCPPGCRPDKAVYQVEVTVTPIPPEYRDDARDVGFGVFGYGIADCCTLVRQVAQVIRLSSFGQGSRGRQILDELENDYLDNDCSDLTLVPAVDGRACSTGPLIDYPPVDGETVAPGNALYTRQPITLLGGYAEEIYLGIDTSTRGISDARKHPADYYVCRYEGRMAVLLREDMVHNLVHEGLHAVRGGRFNLNGRAPIQEEVDAWKAGNEACSALELPLEVTEPSAGGYGAPNNSTYTPLK